MKNSFFVLIFILFLFILVNSCESIEEKKAKPSETQEDLCKDPDFEFKDMFCN